MTIDSALAIATGGLANINRQFAVISQNIANAGTAGYAREVATQQSMTASGIGMGVWSGPVIRSTNPQLQQAMLGQNANVAGGQARQAALSAIDSVLGQPGGGSDLASLVGKLQDSFSALAGDPSNQAQQGSVVAAAQTLANGINTLANAYATQRQTAQDGLVSQVSTLNATLTTIGQLSDRIVQLSAAGQDTADLENQRDAAEQAASQLVDLRFIPQANGDVLAVAGNGVQVPLRAASGPFSMAQATLGPDAFYPSTAPGLLMNGVDVTGQITGGQIGANLTLRDITFPTDQAELDEFSQNPASRFNAQGLTLFTDPAGNVPSGGGMPVQSGYVGFANIIQVNPDVLATPSLVRDGTPPVTGPAGSTDLVMRVLNYTFGSESAPGVPQPASQTGGLGPGGTLSAPYTAPATLAGIASSLVSAQAADSARTSDQLTTDQAVQTSLQSKLAATTGVSVDSEMALMVQLQNAYSANARVISAAQAMWADLVGAVTPNAV